MSLIVDVSLISGKTVCPKPQPFRLKLSLNLDLPADIVGRMRGRM